MTDRDHSLQDAFDRHLRGDAPPPDTNGDPEATAYKAVYAALNEEPEGDLPDDFAERVADRAGLTAEPVVSWAELLLLLLAISGFGAILVTSPSVLGTLQESLHILLRPLERLAASIRLDVLLATGLVLALTIAFDSLLPRWRPTRRAFST